MLELLFTRIYNLKIAKLYAENSENCTISKQSLLWYHSYGTNEN